MRIRRTRSVTTLSQWPMVGTNHRQALERVVLPMEWNNISSRGRSSASNRSSRATSKRDQQHRGHRTPRTAGPLIQILKPEAICNNPPVAMVTTVTVSTPESDGKVLIPGPQACRTTVLILEAIAVGGFGEPDPGKIHYLETGGCAMHRQGGGKVD